MKEGLLTFGMAGMLGSLVMAIAVPLGVIMAVAS